MSDKKSAPITEIKDKSDAYDRILKEDQNRLPPGVKQFDSGELREKIKDIDWDKVRKDLGEKQYTSPHFPFPEKDPPFPTNE